MKRILCVAICIMLMMSMVIPVKADDDGYDDLREQIITAMYTGERLDISEYQLTRDEMLEIYEDLFNRGLLPWYADTFCDWSNAPDGTITVIVLRDLRKRSFSEDSYERAMAELLAATCHEGMTDLQKVLSVHDYIVSRAEYNGTWGTTNNGYHALVKGETQCYGYAQLFLRVMDRLGIPCEIVICDDTGEGMGHAWNVVKLDGNWYHLDLTWDDPLPDAPGMARHTYFLKTDMEFKWKFGHDFGWKTETDCKDKTYSQDNIWDDIVSQIIFTDADTMIFRRNEALRSYLCALDIPTGKETVLHSMDYEEILLDGEYYYGYGGSLSLQDGRAWFNSATAIYSIALDGSDLRTEYIYDVASNNRYVFGFSLNGQTLRISLINLQDEVKEVEIALPDDQYHNHDYVVSYVSPTCEMGGYTLKTCACGISYQIDKVSPTGHVFIEEKVDGLLKQQCTNCDYAYVESVPETEPIPTIPNEVHEGLKVPDIPVAAIVFGVALLCVGILLIRIGKKKADKR